MFRRAAREVDDGARITPVVGRTYTDGLVPWPTISVPEDEPPMVEVSAQMPDHEFGFLMAELLQIHGRAGTSAEKLVQDVLENNGLKFHLFPGLAVFASDGQVITSGCCCCLGEWREWLDVLEGGAIWLGHDPSPGISVQDGVVRVWSDHGLEDQSQASEIAMTVEHYKAELERMRLDLMGLAERIRQWAIPLVGSDAAASLHFRFDRDFSVSADYRSKGFLRRVGRLFKRR